MASRRVLLVNPWIHDFAAYDLWLKPLGLLYVAESLRRAGFEVSLIDCLNRGHPALGAWQEGDKPRDRSFGCGNFPATCIEKPALFYYLPRRFRRYGLPERIFRDELARAPRPEIVMLTSGMTYWYTGVQETIRCIRDILPNVPVILGGIYASLCGEHARANSGADFVVEGPGEHKAVELAASLCGMSSPASQEWDSLRPAYDLLSPLHSVSILTSRGCPMRCSYCASHLLWPGFVERKPEDVITEILHYATALGQRDVAFYDDALLMNWEEHLKPILEGLCSRHVRLRFHTPNGLHVRLVSEEVARLFHQTGFTTVRLSFESAGTQHLMDPSNKSTPDDLEAALDALESASYARSEVGVYVLTGMPGQTMEQVFESFLTVHSKGALIKIAEFSPIPGTPAFRVAVEECGLPADEPLFQNPSVLPLERNDAAFYRLEAIKSLSSLLNRAARRGEDISGSPEVAQALHRATR